MESYRSSFAPSEDIWTSPSILLSGPALFEALVVFYSFICACPLRSRRTTSIRHQERGLTLVFGSDGQVSLIGFDNGLGSQVPYTLTASITGASTPGTYPLPSQPTSGSLIPNLEATTAPLAGTESIATTMTMTPFSTPISSSLAPSSYDSSSTPMGTDTNLPSIPTINFPTPSPTPVSDPKGHDVGAPFYLAIVLASISFIGCVAAFIAWWIRSRIRRRDLELNDPWNHGDTVSDSGSPFTDNTNALEKGAQIHEETQTRPYYLPASIVRRSLSNLLGDTIPTVEDGTSQNNTSRTVLAAGRNPSLHPANDPRSRNMGTEPNPYQNASSSQATNPYSRPGTERLQTGLSVQESTRTLGRLRVANRVPGDITSGDEGGTNMPRLQNGAGLSPVANTSGPNVVPVGENAMQNINFDQSGRSLQERDGPLEPPGPATLSWGRRTDTVAALRRTRRRTPGTAAQTYNNASYGGYLYPKPDGESSGTMSQTPAAVGPEQNENVHANPFPDALNWKNTLKSSFWQAVDAMTGNRPSDSELPTANDGGGSRFTPAPQRIASRRSPVSPIRTAISSSLPDPCIARSRETETKYDPTFSDKSAAIQEMATHSSFVGASASRDESEVPQISKVALGGVGSPLPKVSRLNSDLGVRRHPDSLRTDTGSMYSTESMAARANLRKYGYLDSIPSSWSALGAARESQLDLGHTYLPLPRPMSSSPSPVSVMPSQLTFESALLSSNVSTRTRTPAQSAQSESDFIGSDASLLRSGKHSNTASGGDTTSPVNGMSRNGTIQSGRSTIGHGTVPLHFSSTTSSMVSRKKGVTARRKRPRLPPRAPSSASSVQSMESGMSIREVAVRRALLERRKKVKAAESLKGREDSLTHASSSLV